MSKIPPRVPGGSTTTPDAKPELAKISVWDIVSQPGVYDRMTAIARAKKADWQRPSWSVADVTHQAVERLAEQSLLPDPSDRHAFDAAFRAALKRTLIDRLRMKQAKKRGFGLVRVALGRVTAPPQPAGHGEDDARAILAQYEARRPRHTLVLWLHAVHDFSYAEIAESLGLTEHQVQSALRLAKAELKEQLAAHAPSRGL